MLSRNGFKGIQLDNSNYSKKIWGTKTNENITKHQIVKKKKIELELLLITIKFIIRANFFFVKIGKIVNSQTAIIYNQSNGLLRNDKCQHKIGTIQNVKKGNAILSY